jgi:hypothetical protein
VHKIDEKADLFLPSRPTGEDLGDNKFSKSAGFASLCTTWCTETPKKHVFGAQN